MPRIQQLYRKYCVRNVKALVELCRKADQARMKSLTWDYQTDSLDTQIVNDLKTVTRAELKSDELWRVNQCIWMWFHHAVSCAIYKHKDSQKALNFVEKALRYQARIENHPNKITLLFSLLLKEKFREANLLLPEMPRGEKGTARDMVRAWEKKSPFAGD